MLQFVKCGFAGTNFPSFIFPSLVGRPIVRSTQKVGSIEVKVGFTLERHRITCVKLPMERKRTFI